MPATLNADEESQTLQVVEMFEVITQTQPLDYQSLEILKEAYAKLGRDRDALSTSKRIASAYVQLGQLSSAILEYESILQRFPDDPDVLSALGEIENRATNISTPRNPEPDWNEKPPASAPRTKSGDPESKAPLDDGLQTFQKVFVEGKHISSDALSLHWPTLNSRESPKHLIEPFVHVLAEKQILPIETSLKLISEKSRLGFLPLDRYDVDVELARTFPRDLCLRWCILPFDRMSKSVLVATVNPFNKQATRDLEAATKQRLLWYLTTPSDLMKVLKKIFR